MKTLLSKEHADDYLNENKSELCDLTLAEHLQQLFEESPLTKTAVIKASGLDSTYVHQLFRGDRKNPSRDKLLCLAFGLKLNLDQTQRLLRVGNCAVLYPRSRRDSIIIFSISKEYDVWRCNEELEREREKPLT